MTYHELLKSISRYGELAPNQRVIEAFFEAVKKATWAQKHLVIPGFITFNVRRAKARTIRNPHHEGAHEDPGAADREDSSLERVEDEMTKSAKGRLESQVQAGVLAYLSIRNDIIFWRQNTGAVSYGPGMYVKFGLPGAADIQGIQGPSGRFVGIEVKREIGGRVSILQEAWGRAIESAGGLYVVARDVETVALALGPELARVTKVTAGHRVYPK